MFIVYRGNGFVVLPIYFLCIVVPALASIAVCENYQTLPRKATLTVMMVGAMGLGGTLLWRLGRAWNRDAPTANHSMYGVPVEHWGYALYMFAVVVLLFGLYHSLGTK